MTRDLTECLFEFLLRMGDNSLILSHRASEWCGHAPALEEDIAMANTALDLVGQAQLWLSLAADIKDEGASADDLAYLRDAAAFRNLLLLELPNGDFAQTLMRQFLFDAWHLPMLQGLMNSSDKRLADIAEKTSKEVAYHLERSSDLVIRLGDGTQESHRRVQDALDYLWPYTRELSSTDELETRLMNARLIPDPGIAHRAWSEQLDRTFQAATLVRPEGDGHQLGGKSGKHTEHLGYILAQSQFLQRTYPDAVW